MSTFQDWSWREDTTYNWFKCKIVSLVLSTYNLQKSIEKNVSAKFLVMFFQHITYKSTLNKNCIDGRPFAKECLILERRKCSALLSRKQCLLCLIVTGCSLAADVLMKFDQLPIGCSCPYLCCCWCLGCLRMTSCGVDQDSDFKWQNWHKDIFLQLDYGRTNDERLSHCWGGSAKTTT